MKKSEEIPGQNNLQKIGSYVMLFWIVSLWTPEVMRGQQQAQNFKENRY